MYVLSGKTLEIKWLDSRFYFIFIIINEEPFYIKLILKYANVVIEERRGYVC